MWSYLVCPTGNTYVPLPRPRSTGPHAPCAEVSRGLGSLIDRTQFFMFHPTQKLAPRTFNPMPQVNDDGHGDTTGATSYAMICTRGSLQIPGACRIVSLSRWGGMGARFGAFGRHRPPRHTRACGPPECVRACCALVHIISTTNRTGATTPGRRRTSKSGRRASETVCFGHMGNF